MTASPKPSGTESAGARFARALRSVLPSRGQLDFFSVFSAPAAEDHPAPPRIVEPVAIPAARPFFLNKDRGLAPTWRGRADDNLTAIALSAEIAASGRPATPEDQAKLIRFTGFGATDLANGIFRRPGESDFRPGWREMGERLEALTSATEYAALAQGTQYAHFTPEGIVRAIWAAVTRFGFTGGPVLEPGIGTGLFAALMPADLRGRSRLHGIEADPVTARIAAQLHPDAEILAEDFAASRLRACYALAIGNPPYSSRVVRTDPAYRALGLRLHDYFITKAVDALAPGGFAAFVTSQGTLDKADPGVRARIAERCDFLGAIRLPVGAFSDEAGTEVGTDILFLRRRRDDEAPAGENWIETAPVSTPETDAFEVNRYFVEHPHMVLGAHSVGSGPFGPTYACKPIPGLDLDEALAAAIATLPGDLGAPDSVEDGAVAAPAVAIASGGNTRLREGSYFLADDDVLVQVEDGEAVPVAIKGGGRTQGIFPKHAKLIRALIPIRDSVRAILAAQERHEPCAEAQARLRSLYAAFVRAHGPINATTVQVREADADGARTETHRQPNLAPFRDDPDCWLVASIEDYDLESNTATPGKIFDQIVIAQAVAPEIRTAADALARCLHEHGTVDMAEIAALRGVTPAETVAELADAVFRNPVTGEWETADEYLSGKVRDKLAEAAGRAERDPAFRRNVEALEAVQPTDIPPSDITARLGQPWIPVDVIERFLVDIIRVRSTVRHYPDAAMWAINEYDFAYAQEADLRWGTHRYGIGKLILDALNARTPQVFDTVQFEGRDVRELNVEETEAAKDKLQNLKGAFESWVWKDGDRADRLARIYNDAYNNLVARRFDGSHLSLPGSSQAVTLRPHQKRAIWRMTVAGSTYLAHAVGAGKSWAIAGAIMEQRRLALITKAIVAVPGHCLAQFAREFLHLYPLARILVADETNFAKDKRRRFLARAAMGDWDAIIITHSAFRFIGLPAAFERHMLEQMIAEHTALIDGVDRSDRLTRKQLERKKEALKDRLATIALRRDEFLTLGEIGIDQIIVDEAAEFRKLSFTTNMTSLKGVDSDGSHMAWDLFAKSRYLRQRRAAMGLGGVDRALNLASGTPITNTLGEMFTLQRFMDPDGLEERGIQEFDAWAALFGETRTELELQPSGRYKPVTRFAEFVNVPELIAMFRSFADVVSAEDLRQLVARPPIVGGKRRIITAPPSGSFRDYQRRLDARIKAIEARSGRPKPGEDIILSVIGDGRHAAIDMRLVAPGHADEPENKLNRLIAEVLRIHAETAGRIYAQPDGTLFERPGASQMIFSDLGTLSAEERRGFSPYRWIKRRLVEAGIPATEIAFVQDAKGSKAKARLFADMRAGKVRIVIGSTKKMGTGVNAQNRMKALHHLDVPWLPSDIEQREGRIDRQGNQNTDGIEILAYATEGSMDATMWQANERKARFIAAALSGDRSIRRLEDVGEGSVDQFAMAKAIASGDPRLLQKAGLEAEISRLTRLRDAHHDEQHSLRARLRSAERSLAEDMALVASLRADIATREPAGDGFHARVMGLTYTDRTDAGRALVKAIRDLEFRVLNGRSGRGHERSQEIAVVRGFTVGHRAALEAAFSGKDALIAEIAVMTAAGPRPLRGSSVTPGAILFEQIAEVIEAFDERLGFALRRIERAQEDVVRVRPMIGRAFDLEAELAGKKERHAELLADLARDEDAPTTV